MAVVIVQPFPTCYAPRCDSTVTHPPLLPLGAVQMRSGNLRHPQHGIKDDIVVWRRECPQRLAALVNRLPAPQLLSYFLIMPAAIGQHAQREIISEHQNNTNLYEFTLNDGSFIKGSILGLNN